MKIKDLIKELESFNQDCEIYIEQEGNKDKELTLQKVVAMRIDDETIPSCATWAKIVIN